MALDVALGIIKEMHKPYKIKHFKRRYNNYEIRNRCKLAFFHKSIYLNKSP